MNIWSRRRPQLCASFNAWSLPDSPPVWAFRKFLWSVWTKPMEGARFRTTFNHCYCSLSLEENLKWGRIISVELCGLHLCQLLQTGVHLFWTSSNPIFSQTKSFWQCLHFSLAASHLTYVFFQDQQQLSAHCAYWISSAGCAGASSAWHILPYGQQNPAVLCGWNLPDLSSSCFPSLFFWVNNKSFLLKEWENTLPIPPFALGVLFPARKGHWKRIAVVWLCSE